MVTRSRAHTYQGVFSILFPAGLALALFFSAICLPMSAGLRIVSVKSLAKPSPAPFVAAVAPPPSVPLEGPLMAVALVLSDQRDGEFEFLTTAHFGVDGFPLIPDTTGFEVAVGFLDSGAATHLIAYHDAVRLGLQDSFLTFNTFEASGAAGSASLDISQPIGIFAQGLQDLDEAGHARTDRMFGQGNFACGVNTLANEEEGSTVPTVLGAPFFLQFPAYIRNSQPTNAVVFGRSFSSPSVTFYDDPLNENIPHLARRIFLETRPPGGSSSYLALFDPEPIIPSVILAGLSSALFFTASDMIFTNGGNTARGRMLVDTGAQATVLGEIAAAELDLDMQHPDFEVELQGIGGTVTRPGFYIDAARLPAQGGAIIWGRIPVIILNVASPEGGTLFGIFGSNLLATRDLVFNGAASPPYLDLTEPIVAPVLRITGTRMPTTNSLEIDWRAEPAPAVLRLEATDLSVNPPRWTSIATGELATVTGTMSVTGLVSRQFFRLVTP